MDQLCHSFCIFFFFSSRRRHTRFDCDWSSDVCSSDLAEDAFRRLAIDGARGLAHRSSVDVDLRPPGRRSEEHTSELQSQSNLVCRLLLEKKKTKLLRCKHVRISVLCSAPAAAHTHSGA